MKEYSKILPKKIFVAPSVLSADFGKLNEEIASIEPFADWLHLDIMDFHFVPNLTFGPPVIRCLKTQLFMDAHLMVEHPENYFDELSKIGVGSVTVHQEGNVHLHRLIMLIHEFRMKASVALNPATSVDTILPIISDLDMVLIMSVNPGFGGQKFIPIVLEKIRLLKKHRSDLLVQVDGGINLETAKMCREAGADVLVAGSYIFESSNRAQAIANLRGK